MRTFAKEGVRATTGGGGGGGLAAGTPCADNIASRVPASIDNTPSHDPVVDFRLVLKFDIVFCEQNPSIGMNQPGGA